MVNKGELSKVSPERMPKNRAISYLKVKQHHCQYGNNYKISHGTLGCMPFRRVCLISGCILAMHHFIAAADFSLQVSIVAWSYISDLFHGALKKNRSPKGNTWSAIPVALLCLVVNQNERKQGSGSKGDKVLYCVNKKKDAPWYKLIKHV